MHLRILAVCVFLACTAARASVAPIGIFDGSALLTFTGLADGTEVNGLSVGGVTFAYTIGGLPANGDVVIDGGPGDTNNISQPNIVSVGNNTGVLSLTLPGAFMQFGFGYAILSTSIEPAATTITLFMDTSNVGSLSYLGSPDPTFTGGFAGIQSTIPFNRAELTFNSVAAPAFAVDNVRFGNVPVPEPGTFSLIGLALFAGPLILRRGFRRNPR